MKKTHIWLLIAGLLIVLGGLVFVMSALFAGWNFKELLGGKFLTRTYDVAEDFSSIELKTDTADITFLPAEDGVCKIVSYNRERVTDTPVVDNGKLTVNTVDGRKWYERMFGFGAPTLTVYLPKSEYAALVISEDTGDISVPKDFSFEGVDISRSTGDVQFLASVSGNVKIKGSTGATYVGQITAASLEITVSTGRVSVSGLTCAGDLSVKVSTGDVKISDATCQSLHTTGDTGDMDMENITVRGNISAQRSTGRIALRNANCAGNIEIRVSTGKTELTDVTCQNLVSKGSTGKVVLQNVIANAQISIERSTGDVRFDACDAAELFVTTDTGDVKGSLRSEKVFIARTDTGHVDVPKTITGGRCEITTDTGDIHITVG